MGPVVNGAGLYTRFTPVHGFELGRALAVVVALAGLAAVAVHLLPGSDRAKGVSLALVVLGVAIYPEVARRLHVRPYGWSDGLLFTAYLATLLTVLAMLARLAPTVLGETWGVMALLALAFAGYTAWFGATVTRTTNPLAGMGNVGGPPLALPGHARPPDIIHVIFDGLGRLDYLQRDFGVPADATHRTLDAAGMSVVDDAVANYCQTYLSVAAMLSMDYLDGIAARLGHSRDRTAVEEVISDRYGRAGADRSRVPVHAALERLRSPGAPASGGRWHRGRDVVR